LYSAYESKESLGTSVAKQMCFQRSSERIEGESRPPKPGWKVIPQVDDRQPRKSYRRVCCVFVARSASGCHWNGISADLSISPQSTSLRAIVACGVWLVASVWVMLHVRVKVATTAYRALETETTVR